jgi:hypothetical protein
MEEEATKVFHQTIHADTEEQFFQFNKMAKTVTEPPSVLSRVVSSWLFQEVNRFIISSTCSSVDIGSSIANVGHRALWSNSLCLDSLLMPLQVPSS